MKKKEKKALIKRERAALINRVHWYIFVVAVFSLTFNVVQASAYASLEILYYNPELIWDSMFTRIMR